MIAYIFLALFTVAAVIFIINSHYRWTYFFAIALFSFLFGGMLMVSGQWQRALNFSSVLFVVLMLFSPFKNSLLQTTFANFRFPSCGGLAKLGNFNSL